MRPEDYRKAFDSLSFSDDFQARTTALLRTRARELEKEHLNMKRKNPRKKWIVAVAVAAALAVSVSAAVLLLGPSDVARRMEAPALAAAFEGGDAVRLDETRPVGDYDVTLQGLVSGRGLTDWSAEIDSARTYVVLSLTRRDGAPLTEIPDELNFTPLVQGYNAWAVNAWTLGSGWSAFSENGVAYYLFDTESIEMFADRTVYFAVYEGGAPSAETFEMHEDGAITLREGVAGALFSLPLDAAKADPAAARAFAERTGIPFAPLTDEARAALEAETPAPDETQVQFEVDDGPAVLE